MNVNKRYARKSINRATNRATNRALPVQTRIDLYQRVTALLPTVVMRSWVRNYMLSRPVQMAIDATIGVLSITFAHILRFDGWPPGIDADRMLLAIPFIGIARLISNYRSGVYSRVWRYVSIPDAAHIFRSVGSISAILMALRLAFPGIYPMLTVPISIIVVDFMLTTSLMLAARLFWRVTCENAAQSKIHVNRSQSRSLLVGAGDVGIMAAREIGRRRDLGLQVCGFVDDDPNKHGAVIQGVKVIGATSDIPSITRLHHIDQVIITLDNARRKTIRRLFDLCEEAGAPVKIVPAIYEILGNHVTISNVRPVQIEDLLGRDTIDVAAWLEASYNSYHDKRVLITGAGGSIGRELCRQIATLDPASIILLDKDENSVFEAERELRMAAGLRKTEIIPVICDLRGGASLRNVFSQRLPQVVFHAAAHKHVPLLESNASEAVLNNIGGTLRLLECAAQFEVERCVMVSTDKAVNPTNIMGATKRVSELMFQAQAMRNGGHYSCVRFGNVLNSRGSVVPIFREQIKQGRPITVTHPDVERYFMTIPEAAQLIIQAGALGQRGEIFLLEMGEPVRVVDLAKDMIWLSGLSLGEDIDIEFTGLRPGEKLKEELLIAEEGALTTRHEKIFVAPPLHYDFSQLGHWVEKLTAAAAAGDDATIYKIFSEMEIGFRPAQTKNLHNAEGYFAAGA